MSSQKFRARAINASKQIAIYTGDKLADMSECSTVPDLSTVFVGMEKEEQYEHHLLAKIFEGRVIPVPDVTKLEGADYQDYQKMYPSDHAAPKQLIRVDPFGLDQEDVSNYDVDDEDEMWINTQAKDLGITIPKFENIIDKLESMSQYSIVTLAEAKVSLDESEELLTCIYDYWQNKRLKLQQPLIPTVPSACGSSTKNANPYVAFRRPFLNMQTRRNKKNDEKLYIRVMLIRQDLVRILGLIDLVRQREITKKKKQLAELEIFEKRYAAEDWSGELLMQVTNDVLSKPVTKTEVAPKVTDEEGQFAFIRRNDCTYLAPKPFDARPQSPTVVYNAHYARGNRFTLLQAYQHNESNPNESNINSYETGGLHLPASICQANGLQMFQPAMASVCYLPPGEEEIPENKQLNAYRFNDNELVLCSELNKGTVEHIFQEGLLNPVEDLTYSPLPDASPEGATSFDLDDMFVSMDLVDDTGSLYNNHHEYEYEYEYDPDTVGCSKFLI